MFVKMSHEHLRSLLKNQEGPCISIYISKQASLQDYDERYFEILEKVASVLSYGKDALVNTALLTDLLRFTPSDHLKSVDEGIAIFKNRTQGSFYICQMPIVDKFMVSQSFYLKPILEELQGEHVFNILLLLSESAKLISCQGHSWIETNSFMLDRVDGEFFVHWKRFNENIYYEIQKARAPLKAFLKDLDSKLKAEPEFDERPLIVYSPLEVYSVFKRVATHPDPLFVETQGDLLKGFTENLLPEAHTRMRSYLKDVKQKDTQEYIESSARKMASDRLEDISSAVIKGRVKKLLLQKNSEVSGHYNRANGHVIYYDRVIETEMADVLDDIACDVLLRGGEVVLLEKSEMPTMNPLAAIFSS
ncbi:hypothetical protein BDW_08580 [Bdellovibrio bacteriovorus W]|nr:hypothetical protein BDW_08580 [Bdellovibrio bacteriovorus W]